MRLVCVVWKSLRNYGLLFLLAGVLSFVQQGVIVVTKVVIVAVSPRLENGDNRAF